ncbi:peptidoglycan-binding protein [Luteimonas sp. SX5]|uniref:Peptidoglycan-binding protein n=1 Tax=Luteimonas galliterrae TaxID=2940486 RepID=A0ABT0MLL1_9GAMM|nr:XVIPCD domain-containing protein [Luteimonas galliterrae]MCL1635110.1 peptidoglycan-binding protein [Luteimonas galliterrae]
MSRDYTKAEVLNIVEDQARAHGIPSADFLRFAFIETGGRFDEQASRGPNGAKGLFQFVPSTARQYGIDGREFDPVANTEAAARLYLENRRSLARSHEMTGRPYLSEREQPDGLDMYLAHQQGAAGYRSIQNAIEGGQFSRRDTRANMLNNVSAKDFEMITGKDYRAFVRMSDQDMSRAFVGYWAAKFDRIRIPEKGIEPSLEARPVREEKPRYEEEGIALRAAYDLTMKHDRVRYGFGKKAIGAGRIDCSGWAVEMINTSYSEVNAKAGKVVYAESDRFSLGMDAAASIVRKSVQMSGILIEGRQIDMGVLREGMVIGEDNGNKVWDKGRYKGIDHIVFVLRDPGSGELMISQSRSGEGVELVPAEDYLAYKQKRGAKLYASDPLFEARPLLKSDRDLSPYLQTRDVSRRADEVMHAISHELDEMLPMAGRLVGNGGVARYVSTEHKRAPWLSEPEHPDYQLYSQFYDKLKQLGKNELGYSSEAAYVNAAASLAVSARSNGLTRIDHIIMSTDGKGIFAVQGRMDDPANNWLQVDKAQAAGQSVQISTAQMDLVVQERGVEPALANEIRVVRR